MIHVDRNRVAAPEFLRSHAAETVLADAAAHFADDGPRSRQTRFDFRDQFLPDVLPALRRLFHDKCAFCESQLDPSAPKRTIAPAGSIVRFRPLQEAVGLSGDVDRAHYWWLAFEWENLYLICSTCDYERGERFPVEGRRARVSTPLAQARRDERPLLLDPCFDDPAKHLLFLETGAVMPRSVRGEHTIDAFKLNRLSLVEGREEAVARYLEAHADDRDRLRPTLPYAAALRDAARRVARKDIDQVRSLPQSFSEVPAVVEPVELDRIELRDFRGIEQLSIDLAGRREHGDGRAPAWTMLLGENGHGKSTILQAIAIALMGSQAQERLKLAARSDWIRDGAARAEIVLTVRGELEPRVVRIERIRADRVTIVAEREHAPAALAAYGASRIPLPVGRDWLPRRYRVRPRVENLFDPHAELMDVQQWLNSLGHDAFGYVARALRRVLLEPESTVLTRTPEDIWLDRAGSRESLRHLSDGYRAMIVLAVDLMSFFQMRFGSMDAAEGVVLIDELGAHLHPRWQMRIVEALRAAFPRLQVIATTHDPLCLRGLGDGEVVVLRRTSEDHLFALQRDELPPLRGLRVDELLTSEIFGLNSTLDEQLDRLFTQYYALLQRSDRSARVHAEIARLREQLDGYRQFGATTRERLALEAADDFVARQRNLADDDARRRLGNETRARLLRIWAGQDG